MQSTYTGRFVGPTHVDSVQCRTLDDLYMTQPRRRSSKPLAAEASHRTYEDNRDDAARAAPPVLPGTQPPGKVMSQCCAHKPWQQEQRSRPNRVPAVLSCATLTAPRAARAGPVAQRPLSAASAMLPSLASRRRHHQKARQTSTRRTGCGCQRRTRASEQRSMLPRHMAKHLSIRPPSRGGCEARWLTPPERTGSEHSGVSACRNRRRDGQKRLHS